jgi:hypothetical protein
MQHQHIVQHQGEGNGAPSYGQQLRDIHTNALPGVTRPEEGEVVINVESGVPRPVQQSYDEMERARARNRYEEYLDEQDSEKLPSAFDLGWRQNFLHLFGPKPILWWLPICNTTGDGWSWEPSPKWLAARERLRQERERQLQLERDAGWGHSYDDGSHMPLPPREGAGRHYLTSPVPSVGRQSPSKADRILGRDPNEYTDGPEAQRQNNMPMQNLRRGHNDLADDDDGEDYESSSDELEVDQRKKMIPAPGWSAQKVVGPASGMFARVPSPKKDDWNKWDRDADDGVD